MHLPACGKCRSWLFCRLAAFARVKLYLPSKALPLRGLVWPLLSCAGEGAKAASTASSSHGPLPLLWVWKPLRLQLLSLWGHLCISAKPNFCARAHHRHWAGSRICTLGDSVLRFTVVRRTRIDRAVQKPDLTLKAGADPSATQLVEWTLLDGVGQFCCLK